MKHITVYLDKDYAHLASDGLRQHEKLSSRRALSVFDNFIPFSTVLKLKKQDMFIHEGDKALNFYEIIFGYVQTYTLLRDGRRLVINFFRKGDFIGLPHYITYNYSAQALSRTNLRCYSYAQLHNLLDTTPELGHKILEITQKQLTHANKQMVLLGRKSPIEKVASFLLSCERRPAIGANQHMVLYIPMSLTDIADYLGLAKETVCRIIGKLKHYGLVETRMPHQLYVYDINALYKFSRTGE